jgi:hypothetical protein
MLMVRDCIRKVWRYQRGGWPLWNICVTNDHGYVPFVENTSRSFSHSWFITGFITRLTRRVPLVEQELLTLPEYLSSPPVLTGVRVTRFLVLCVCFVNRCLSFWPLCCLFFCLVFCWSFWLPHWYLQTFLESFMVATMTWLEWHPSC